MPRRSALLLLAILLMVPMHLGLAAIVVVTTTQDLQSLTEVVGKELVSVVSLVTPGADAEAYEPRPSDLLHLANAAVIVRVGLGYDDWLDRLLVQHGDARLARGGSGHVDASVGIPLLEVQGRSVEFQSDGHAHGLANPHYWLDPANARFITASIVDGLARAAPEQAAQFAANRQAFLHALEDRLATWKAQLAPFAGTAVVAYHNAWPYFARRFRLNVIAAIEPKEGVPPSPGWLVHIAADMRATHALAVLVTPQEPSEPAQAVAARTGAHIALVAGSVGELPDAGDYLSLFETDVNALLSSLSRTGG